MTYSNVSKDAFRWFGAIRLPACMILEVGTDCPWRDMMLVVRFPRHSRPQSLSKYTSCVVFRRKTISFTSLDTRHVEDVHFVCNAADWHATYCAGARITQRTCAVSIATPFPKTRNGATPDGIQ